MGNSKWNVAVRKEKSRSAYETRYGVRLSYCRLHNFKTSPLTRKSSQPNKADKMARQGQTSDI